MNRPPLEVADIVRCAGQSFVERNRRWITWQHQKILLAIARCRTAALGGHRDQCSDCGHTAISYNSCRNRHCPKCQGNARLRWLQARERELLHFASALNPPMFAGRRSLARKENLCSVI
jgi:Transposase zinc-binding domain